MTCRPDDQGAGEVIIARGNLYLSRELCEMYFAGITAVALLRRGDTILVAPLIPDSAGGLLLKQRNARGDRVIHAQEFIRLNGIAEHFERRAVPTRWHPQAAALLIEIAPG